MAKKKTPTKRTPKKDKIGDPKPSKKIEEPNSPKKKIRDPKDNKGVKLPPSSDQPKKKRV